MKYGARAKHFPLMSKTTEGLKARVKLGMATITSRHIDAAQNTLSLLRTANMTVLKEILKVYHELNNSEGLLLETVNEFCSND
jgi:hypothetical protein